MSDSFATPWTVVHQAPLTMEFPRKDYWSGLPLPPPGDLSKPGMEPMSFALAGGFFTTEPPGELAWTLNQLWGGDPAQLSGVNTTAQKQ